uniref:Ig-like domain-containing protein n=1 Tax=Anabas testudineus TaxID=64144 RepID=A0A7N6C5M6_ANATE
SVVGCCSLTLSLTFVSHVFSSEQYEIKAEPGDTVTLPCGVHSNISIIVVEWSRTDLETEYVFLQRGSRSESFKQHESFKNRVELKDREKKDGDVSLILRNVTFNDTGTYECRVVQRRTNHRKRSILKSDPIITLKLTGISLHTNNLLNIELNFKQSKLTLLNLLLLCEEKQA